MTYSRAVFFGSGALAAFLGAAPAPLVAQPQGDEFVLQEITVTAQRREENLQDVPLAVTALTGETLAKNDIRDLSRVELLTPGFSFGKSGSDARPAIRGVRTENIGVSGDPTIGFFVDNVYRSRASQANEPFVDIERVEVQRGPQGTLYGRNTFGGNVALSSTTPRNEFEAGVNVTFGRFDRASLDAFVNVPFSDKVQFRLAGLREEMDGFVDGIDDNHDIFDRDTEYARASLRFAPNEAFESVLRYSYWSEQGTGGAAFGYRVGGIFVNPTTGSFDINGQPFLLLYDIPRTGQPLATGTPINPDPHFYPGDTLLEQDLEQHALSLNLSYELGPVVLRSITGYVDYEVFRNADNDFSTRLGNVDGQEDQLESYSQELQIASNEPGAAFEWIAGYFYFVEDVEASFFSSCPTAARNTAGCAFAAGLPRTISNALFGQASYWLVPERFRLTAGVRRTEDNKRISRATATTDATQRLATVTRTGQVFDFDFNKTTWRVNGDYHLSRDNMLYASVSTGFRSGGFNNGAFTNPALPGAFGPEDVLAYEIGSKNRFGNRVQLNVSVYRNDFEDLQVQNQFIVQSPTGPTTTSVILNAAEAHSQGVEVELQLVPIDNMNVTVAATLMEAEYDSYANTPAPANYTGTLDYTGNDIPYSPSAKLTAGVGYDFVLANGGVISPAATVFWSDDYQLTDTNTVLDSQESFTKVDVRLGWISPSSRFSASAFVNNATDEITLNRATFGSRGLNQSYDAPRMWGVRFGARF